MKKLIFIFFYFFQKKVVAIGFNENHFAFFVSPLLFSKESLNDNQTFSKFKNDKILFDFLLSLSYLVHLSKDRYYLNFSLGFETSSVNIKGNENLNSFIEENHNLNYLSISPIGIYLQTEEIMGILDLHLSFCFNFDFKILINSKSENLNKSSEIFIKNFNKVGLDLNLKICIEYILATSSSVSFGFIGILDLLNSIDQANHLSKVSLLCHKFGIFFGIKI